MSNFNPDTIEDKTMFAGKVVSQNVFSTKKGNFALGLTVRLTERLLEQFRPDKGIVELEEEPVVKTTVFFPDDPEDPRAKESLLRLNQTFSELGIPFEGDPMPFDTALPDYVDLVGRRVYVRKSGQYWNLASVRPSVKPSERAALQSYSARARAALHAALYNQNHPEDSDEAVATQEEIPY